MVKKATSEGIAKRDRAFRHNSYKGFTARASINMVAIADSDTVTPEGKQLAEQIILLVQKLRNELETRVD